jgi:transcriptional regulator with XRE-family HTH domain
MIGYQEVVSMTDAIGKRLQDLRRKRGLTLRQLADLADVPQSTLSMVETGARSGENLTLATGRKLARALGISLDVIAGVYDEESETLTAVAS